MNLTGWSQLRSAMTLANVSTICLLRLLGSGCGFLQWIFLSDCFNPQLWLTCKLASSFVLFSCLRNRGTPKELERFWWNSHFFLQNPGQFECSLTVQAWKKHLHVCLCLFALLRVSKPLCSLQSLNVDSFVRVIVFVSSIVGVSPLWLWHLALWALMCLQKGLKNFNSNQDALVMPIESGPTEPLSTEGPKRNFSVNAQNRDQLIWGFGKLVPNSFGDVGRFLLIWSCVDVCVCTCMCATQGKVPVRKCSHEERPQWALVRQFSCMLGTHHLTGICFYPFGVAWAFACVHACLHASHTREGASETVFTQKTELKGRCQWDTAHMREGVRETKLLRLRFHLEIQKRNPSVSQWRWWSIQTAQNIGSTKKWDQLIKGRHKQQIQFLQLNATKPSRGTCKWGTQLLLLLWLASHFGCNAEFHTPGIGLVQWPFVQMFRWMFSLAWCIVPLCHCDVVCRKVSKKNHGFKLYWSHLTQLTVNATQSLKGRQGTLQNRGGERGMPWSVIAAQHADKQLWPISVSPTVNCHPCATLKHAY